MYFIILKIYLFSKITIKFNYTIYIFFNLIDLYYLYAIYISFRILIIFIYLFCDLIYLNFKSLHLISFLYHLFIP